MKEIVYLGLGSNEGDRKFNLDEAMRRLRYEIGVCEIAVSGYIETPSWGFEAPDFLNAVAAFELEDVDPYRLLDICKKIECQMGREENIEYDNQGRRIYHSRPIDIDILLIGDIRIESDRLTIPHPLMQFRDFVMVPLSQLKEIIINKK